MHNHNHCGIYILLLNKSQRSSIGNFIAINQSPVTLQHIYTTRQQGPKNTQTNIIIYRVQTSHFSIAIARAEGRIRVRLGGPSLRGSKLYNLK